MIPRKFFGWFRKRTVAEVIRKDLGDVERELYQARLTLLKDEANLAYFQRHRLELLTMLKEHTDATTVAQ